MPGVAQYRRERVDGIAVIVGHDDA